MPFPEVKRVVYGKNPLEKVICQLRFPPILIIDSEIPAKFQELIRDEFPHYEEKIEVQQEISAEINANYSMNIVNPMTKVIRNKNHTFTSEDGNWQVNLTRTFISITTNKYNTWEGFKDKFKKPLEALIEVYTPPFFGRIGLRYIDVFCRSKLGFEDCPWIELIKPEFLGVLASEVGNYVTQYNNQSEIIFNDNKSRARILTSIVKNTLNEDCFMIDNDSYNPEKVLCGEVVDKLDYIHERSTRLIRFVITDKLHNGMEPEDLC